jgi:hypothetical protein
MDDADPNALKYTTMFRYIHEMNMRNVRDIYKGMRVTELPGPDMLFPRLGITAGEFAVAHVVKLPRRSTG